MLPIPMLPLSFQYQNSARDIMFWWHIVQYIYMYSSPSPINYGHQLYGSGPHFT